MSHLGEFETTKVLYQLVTSGFIDTKQQPVVKLSTSRARATRCRTSSARWSTPSTRSTPRSSRAVAQRGKAQPLAQGPRELLRLRRRVRAALRRPVDGRPAACSRATQLLANLNMAPTDDKLDYLHRGLNELLFFELFTAGEAVDRREEIELHQRLNQIIRGSRRAAAHARHGRGARRHQRGSDLSPNFHFRHDLRVRYVETDAQAVVYHSNYLVYCDAARVEWFRALHGGNSAWRVDRDYDVVSPTSADFESSARFGHALARSASRRRQLQLHLRIASSAESELLCVAKTVHVGIDRACAPSAPCPTRSSSASSLRRANFEAPEAVGPTSSSSDVRRSTRAPGGPARRPRQKPSTALASPCTSPSTSPVGRLRTQPTSPRARPRRPRTLDTRPPGPAPTRETSPAAASPFPLTGPRAPPSVFGGPNQQTVFPTNTQATPSLGPSTARPLLETSS